MKNMPLDYTEQVQRGCKPLKYKFTPELHEAIKRLYQTSAGQRGVVKAFASRNNMPRWRVSRYAAQNGWTAKQKKEPDGSKPELVILKANAMHCPEVVQRKLNKAGYHRSQTGIIIKRKRMRYLSNLNGHSACAVALCLGEDPKFVVKAIQKGLLRATTRITHRTPQQGGDMYFIRDKHLRKFVIENIHMIDLRKVDKYWFVDLLTSKPADLDPSPDEDRAV